MAQICGLCYLRKQYNSTRGKVKTQQRLQVKTIISDSIAVNFFGFDWFVVFFCCVSRFVGESRDGKRGGGRG